MITDDPSIVIPPPEHMLDIEMDDDVEALDDIQTGDEENDEGDVDGEREKEEDQENDKTNEMGVIVHNHIDVEIDLKMVEKEEANALF
jgi:hypothetical protein